MEIDGQAALKFFNDIEACMKAAGVGQRRAFHLITELHAIGLRIVRCEPQPLPQAKLDLAD
jgi:hypothetical protein